MADPVFPARQRPRERRPGSCRRASLRQRRTALRRVRSPGERTAMQTAGCREPPSCPPISVFNHGGRRMTVVPDSQPRLEQRQQDGGHKRDRQSPEQPQPPTRDRPSRRLGRFRLFPRPGCWGGGFRSALRSSSTSSSFGGHVGVFAGGGSASFLRNSGEPGRVLTAPANAPCRAPMRLNQIIPADSLRSKLPATRLGVFHTGTPLP